METREVIYLGALLHDIGKFVFRAQERKQGKDHETLGDEFIREFISKKINAFKANSEEIIKAAKRQTGKVWLADCIVASEREVQDSTETRRPLVSIFKRINIKLGDIPNDIYYRMPDPLEMDISEKKEDAEKFIKRIKPRIEKNTKVEEWKVNEKEMIEAHKKSLELFKGDLKQMHDKFNDTRAALTTLYALLYKYTANICSAGYLSYPDISLFDHSRVVAAVALCLEEADNEKPCLIIKGDVSGIQNFIYYNIEKVEGAAKTLRARSFYIKLLCDTLVSYICDEMKLFEASVFFNSGGHFVIFAPNNKDNREKIKELEKKINEALLEMHGPSLQIIMATLEETAERLIRNYNEIADELAKKLNDAKKRKSFSILSKMINYEKPSDDRKLKKLEKLYEEIGTAIPHSNYLIEVKSDKKLEERKDFICFKHFGIYWKFVSNNEYLENPLTMIENTNPTRCTIYALKSSDFMKNTYLLSKFNYPIAFSFKLIATYAPYDKGKERIKTFDELAREGYGKNGAEKVNSVDNKFENESLNNNQSEKKDGEIYPLLGILRMDVDSLGSIFRHGLKSEKEKDNVYTVSRLATLSRELDLFFTVVVNALAKKHSIYITYSGGDDLFAVGSWINIIEFAKDVREMFGEFTNQNPNVTLSAGISITKPNFPIAKSAKFAGEAEEKAKSTKFGNDEISQKKKDKVNLFDTTVYWSELKDKLEIASELEKLIKNENKSDKSITSSFLYRLLTTTRECFDKNGKFNIEKMHALTAKLHYYFARKGMDAEFMRKEVDSFKKKFANYFLKSSKDERKRWFETFVIPASYIILKNRKPKSINK